MRRVLITDDSLFMRNMLKKLLKKNGYDVIGEAENGRLAVEKYKELSPDFVTMDITMPVMTGIEALREIVKYDENAKVVMVSAMGQSAFVTEAVHSGAKGFLVKPFQEEAVISSIERLFS